MPKAAWLFLVACAALSAACGGGNRETLEKKMSGLQDEVTRLQNTNDRLAERVQALEITSMRAGPAGAGAGASAAAPAQEESRVARPTLKVVKVGPGTTAPAAEAEVEPEPADDSGPRPVIKDHGGPAGARAPAWAKPQAPRAGSPPMGQNAGARRPAPQGT